MRSVQERIKDGEFANNKPYPDVHVTGEERRKQLDEYRIGKGNKIEKFRKALEEENHMTNHPKRNLLWEMAWEHGHASGFYEVEIWYSELIRLVK